MDLWRRATHPRRLVAMMRTAGIGLQLPLFPLPDRIRSNSPRLRQRFFLNFHTVQLANSVIDALYQLSLSQTMWPSMGGRLSNDDVQQLLRARGDGVPFSQQ